MLSVSHPCQVAQNKSAWRVQTCSTHTQPWLAHALIGIIIVFMMALSHHTVALHLMCSKLP